MSRKNDRIIVFGMIAIGVLTMAGIVAVLGLGAYVYANEKPATTPTPAPVLTATPASTIKPVTDYNHTFNVRKVFSDEAGRTYTLFIELKDGAAPVDMSRLTIHVVAGGTPYSVWDFSHGEHTWTGNGNAILEKGETFMLTLYMPQAEVPLHEHPLVEIILLVDGQSAYSLNAPAV